MKKILSLMAAAALAAGAVSCSEKKTEKTSDTEKPSATEAVTTEQPVPADHSQITTASSTTTVTTTTKAATTAAVTTQPDPMGGGVFEYNKDGAVVFTASPSEADDTALIAAGQALFESACRTEWNFTVGCPYDIDLNYFVENDLGWQFYKITDSRIKSLSDVEKDYHKVFSEKRADQLSSLYIEKNGTMYAFCGNRGSDIYYSSSKVTGIKSRSDSEIVFTVDNYYDGSDFGDAAYSTTVEFSVAIGSDNVWKAENFSLPY